MKQEQVLLNESVAKKYHDFLDQILKNCDIDEVSGRFYCKKCKNLVHVDWFRKLAFCSVHIISSVGITYIDELYTIYS